MNTKTRRILLIVPILGVLLLGGGYVGYRAYKSARQARLITQARNYLAKPEERKALLCLQRALRYNAKDVEACRLMAELTERARSPGALIWRSRVVELNSHSLDDRLALAQTAMLFRDYASATATSRTPEGCLPPYRYARAPGASRSEACCGRKNPRRRFQNEP